MRESTGFSWRRLFGLDTALGAQPRRVRENHYPPFSEVGATRYDVMGRKRPASAQCRGMEGEAARVCAVWWGEKPGGARLRSAESRARCGGAFRRASVPVRPGSVPVVPEECRRAGRVCGKRGEVRVGARGAHLGLALRAARGLRAHPRTGARSARRAGAGASGTRTERPTSLELLIVEVVLLKPILHGKQALQKKNRLEAVQTLVEQLSFAREPSAEKV